MKKNIALLLSLLLLATIVLADQQKQDSEQQALFTESEYKAHLRFLSSDICEGRGLGSRGMRIAAEYIAAQFEAAGLKPISEENGYFQYVPLQGYKTDYSSQKVSFLANNKEIEIKPVKEIILNSEQTDEQISFSDDLVFVGYGIVAPEFEWDDYKGYDIAGKTVVMLVNDPDPEKTGFADENLTFYGRWTYKEIIARKLGAKGLLLIHTDESATYGFEVVKTSNTMEQVRYADAGHSPLMINGWIDHEAFNTILKEVGLDYESLKEKAENKDFKPFDLNIAIQTTFTQQYRKFESPNVIGILPGTDLKDECIIYTGHYDHLGVGIPDDSGDTIYNGSMDNASGISALICLANAMKHSGVKPRRSILFFANTGEESGLLGSTWYAEHPIFPLEKTVVAINKDVCSLYGKRAEFGYFPGHYTDAVDKLEEIGAKLGLGMKRDPITDKSGYSFRSDHFPFAGRGIVTFSLGLRGENKSISKEEEQEIREKVGRTYHQPSDEMSEFWRYDGVMLELELLYDVGVYYASSDEKPKMVGKNPFLATMRLFSQQ